MDNSAEQQDKTSELNTLNRDSIILSDNEWMNEVLIDALQCNLATVKQVCSIIRFGPGYHEISKHYR